MATDESERVKRGKGAAGGIVNHSLHAHAQY